MDGGRAQPLRLLLTTDAVGGVWTYALDLARALATRGVIADLAVMGPAPGDHQRREAAAAGVTLHERPCRLEWMDEPWEDVDRAGEWLLDLERAIAPDVVQVNGYCHAALPWRAPAVVVAHSCVCSWWRAVRGEAAPPRFDEYRARVARGLAAARVVVAPSQAMRRALEAEYGPAPIQVIPNGRAGTEAPDGIAREPIVFSAGRLWDEAKNVQAVCDVASSIPWPVFVAGDARDPVGRDRAFTGVRALGVLPAAEMRAWYARASIYALPARYEPFGLSIAEAAGAGCALVLRDIDSLRENWEGAALFVPPGDRAALTSAIRRLIDDEPERRRLSAAAAARARRFSLARMADAYLDVYTEAAAPVAADVA
jgi:glycosyltransferase involved in cell wall biosynthesis